MEDMTKEEFEQFFLKMQDMLQNGTREQWLEANEILYNFFKGSFGTVVDKQALNDNSN